MPRFPPRTKRLWLAATALLLPLAFILVFVNTSRPEATFRSDDFLRRERLASLPRNILWAWERPEHLDFIDPRETGVAYLARTIYLRGESAVVRPRLQPLDVPGGTTLIAVTRIESERSASAAPTLSPAQLTASAEAIAVLARAPGVAAIQIDFDATLSERDFYRALLSEVRRRLPARMPLTITALASWCTHDDWLTGLPVDEAIPMLFRMGVDQRQIDSFLRTRAQFRPQVCRTSAGVSTDEADPNLPSSNVRLYVFHPRAWTEQAARNTFERFRNDKEIP
jgi:hypothetical protein